jgi:tRNA1Val (adenine37-N6)-methyltransferase
MDDAPFYDDAAEAAEAAEAADAAGGGGEQQHVGPACWKCEGTGVLRHRKRLKNPAAYAARYGATPPPCSVCGGAGRVPPKQKQRDHQSDAGVVTERRWVPPHWETDSVPGPAPAGLGKPERGEELCFLTGAWRIFQRVGGHRYTTEDVVTAWTAARSLPRPALALDLGTGIGSVMMMVAWRHPGASAVGVEAQELSAGMARRSLRYNGADARCEVRRADIRHTASWLREGEGETFDLVTGTPPYFPVAHVPRATGRGAAQEAAAAAACEAEVAPATPVAIGAIGALPTCRQSAPARYEFRGGIEAYCTAARAALRRPEAGAGKDGGGGGSGGRFVVCEGYLEGNRARVEHAAAASGLRVLERTDVVGREGKSPLFAVYVMCHADDSEQPAADLGTRKLVVRQLSGERTDEYCELMAEMGMPCGVAGRDF